MNKFLILIFFCTIFLISCTLQSEKYEAMNSPDGNIKVSFWLENGKPCYAATYRDKQIVNPSMMGFVLTGNDTLSKNLTSRLNSTKIYDEKWEQPWGEQRFIRENYTECVFNLTEKDGQKRVFQVIFRVFNDGFGFRYKIPEQPNLKSLIIIDELSEFAMTDNHVAWWIPAYRDNRYEYLYQHSALSRLDTVHTPLTMEMTNGMVMSIHEAALENYAAMTLAAQENNTLKCDLAPWSDGTKVKATTPLQTPWRTVTIGQNPGDLITSTLILNLNEPNKLADLSWIKPNKYLGIWWGMHIGKYTFWEGEKHGATTARSKEYIDFCNKLGVNHLLIEGWNKGWTPAWYENRLHEFNFTESTPDFDFKAVTDYAREKGVNIIGYHETGSNIDNYLVQINDAMQMYKQAGMHDVKIGHVGSRMMLKEWHYGQYAINYYRSVLEKAAENQLTVIFHEPIKPTGLHRTYPNLMAYEGARGQEYNAWSEGNPPEHTVILPFTRLLGGPMDFTPGIFSIKPTRVHSTIAQQLALYLTIYSPVQMLADLPENYIDHPAFKFLQDMPINWENTQVVNAKIGDYYTVARKDRNSSDWYLGSITDENSRTFEIDLGFLDENTTYIAEIYSDGQGAEFDKNPEAITIRQMEVTKNSRLTIHLAKGGGQAIRFKARY